jgi:hypothetical protein
MNEQNDLPESLTHFKCLACGKKREHMHINTFKLPFVEEGTTKIMAYRHFNYCYDNLVCYIKASRNERYKKESE